MRIVADIPHPYFKVTVFKHEGRFSVKIENAHYEQLYKFPEGLIESEEEVLQVLSDGKLLEKSEKTATDMHQSALAAYAVLRKSETEEFDRII